MPGIRCPFRRTARPIVGGNYMRGLSGNNSYVGHHAFAKEPENYVRAFLLLQNDLRRLFEYVDQPTRTHAAIRFACMRYCCVRALRSRRTARQSSLKMGIWGVAIGPWSTTRR